MKLNNEIFFVRAMKEDSKDSLSEIAADLMDRIKLLAETNSLDQLKKNWGLKPVLQIPARP